QSECRTTKYAAISSDLINNSAIRFVRSGSLDMLHTTIEVAITVATNAPREAVSSTPTTAAGTYAWLIQRRIRFCCVSTRYQAMGMPSAKVRPRSLTVKVPVVYRLASRYAAEAKPTSL